MGGTTYLTVRGFFCYPGNALSGSRYTVCQADGTWSTATPNCTANTCWSLSAPINGYVYMDDTTFGSKASFSCNAGYQLTGVSSVTCRTDRTWSAISPRCTKITCPVLATPPNAILSAGPVDFQAKRTFSCSDGYTLSGDSQLVCLLNGSWSAPFPTCSKLAECAPLIIGNAAVSSGPYRVNSIVNITCNAGFELSGSAVVICLDSLKWSSLPICNRVPLLPECPVLVVSNATVSSGSNKVNSIRSVSCNAGFELSGNSMVICLASKSWSTLPVCNKLRTTASLTTTNIVAACIGFFAGLLVPGCLILVALVRRRRKSTSKTVAETNNTLPTGVIVIRLLITLSPLIVFCWLDSYCVIDALKLAQQVGLARCLLPAPEKVFHGVFGQLYALWLRRDKPAEKTRLRLYNAIALAIFLYNC
ncbi:P-selectin-like [Sycon ciliatum]|uniref:P-selectin-like n=1 Tax=Sycon ciliatum TaxID=27933 RepID=UPI0031F69293